MNEIFFLALFIFLNSIILVFYKNISRIVNIYDFPDKRKIHKNKTPLIGGFIIVINFILFSFLVLFDFYEFNLITPIFETKIKYIVFLNIFLLIFFLGALDDKFDLNPNLKLIILTVLITFFLFIDRSLIVNKLTFSFTNAEIYLGNYSFVFTILCFLLFINACNMFDGINLQSTSYFIIIILYLLSLSNKFLFLIFLLISLVFIFLLNFRGKIFMGDSGIYLLSFTVAFLVIKIYNSYDFFHTDLIFILMMVPGIDMFRLFLSRLLKKRNPFSPDKHHIHHILIAKFSNTQSIFILNSLILIPILLTYLNISNLFIILIYIVIYLIFLIKFQISKKNS